MLVVATEEGRVAATAEDAGAAGDAAAAAAGDAAAAAAGDAAAAEVEAGATAAGVLITVGAVVHQAIRSVSKISHSQASNNPVGAYSCSQWFQIGR